MGLTFEVLDKLEARNLQAATDAVLKESNAIALIELLEALWASQLDSAHKTIDTTLLRLQQLNAFAEALRPYKRQRKGTRLAAGCACR